jgi:hypothetical protein
VIDLSQTSSWNGCHADVVNSPTADPNCIAGNDIQKFLGTGTNPTTRAFCSYSPTKIDTQCNGPNSGNITVDLYADKPNSALPPIVSISLDSIDLASFKLSGGGSSFITPKPGDGQCTPKKVGGKDVIECKFVTCDQNGEFIFPTKFAKLTAKREGSGTGIECQNDLSNQIK